MKYPFLSIISVTYNSEEHLVEFINSLKKTDYPRDKYEIIFVDNGSEDTSTKIIEENYSEVNLIKTGSNLGWGAAINIGVENSSGDYVIFMNNDMTMDSNWLKGLLEPFLDDKNIGSTCSKGLYSDNRQILDSYGCYLSVLGISGGLGQGEKHNKYNDVIEIFASHGGCMMMPASLFHKVGRFDPLLFLYCDEIDIGWRIKNHGKKNVFAPNSIIYHIKHGSKLERRDYYYYMTRNRIWVILKNAHFLTIIWFLPLSIVTTFAQYLIFKLKGRTTYGEATLDGLKDSLFSEESDKLRIQRKKLKKNLLSRGDLLGFLDSLSTLKRIWHKHID